MSVTNIFSAGNCFLIVFATCFTVWYGRWYKPPTTWKHRVVCMAFVLTLWVSTIALWVWWVSFFIVTKHGDTTTIHFPK